MCVAQPLVFWFAFYFWPIVKWSFVLFHVGYCIISPSSNYGFWLLLWCLFLYHVTRQHFPNLSIYCYQNVAVNLMPHFTHALTNVLFSSWMYTLNTNHSDMTSFKRFESKPVVKIILIYDRLNLWRHRQFITIFYQFLHIRIEIIHGSHMYILFLPRVGLYVSFVT